MTEASIVAESRSRSDRRHGPLVAFAAVGALGLLALQAFAASRLELTFDEAYYRLWSRDLAFGYLDHPPMVALVIRASTALFGQSELGVRSLSLGLVGALPGLIAVIAWRLFGSVEVAALSVLMWIAAPLVIAGAVFVTPDAPLVLFWTLGLAALVELWRTARARWVLAMGVALGLMALSKFTAAFFLVGAGLAAVATPSLRRWLRSPFPWLGLAIAAAIASPFVVWNAEHGWATFLKQGGRAAAAGFEPYYVAEFVVAQILLVNPLVFPALAAAVWGVSWRNPVAAGSPDEARRLLVSTIAPAAIYFLVHALHDRVQGNWLAPLYPACAILAGDWVSRARRTTGMALVTARAALAAAPLAVAVMLVGFVQATSGALPLGAADPTARLEGYADLARAVDARARADGASYVLTQGYALASLLAVYGDPATPVVQPEQRIRWIFKPSPPEALFQEPGLAISEAGRRYDLVLGMRYRTVEPAGTIERRRGGRPLQAYELYRVADPYAPVLDPPCPSAEVDLTRTCRP